MTNVTPEVIQGVCKRIVEQCNPDRVILFGSYAYGEPTADSDVDFLIIMSFEGRSVDKAVEIRMAVDIPFACDLVIKTPEDARRRYEEFDPIMRYAFNHGKVLYERDRKRVA